MSFKILLEDEPLQIKSLVSVLYGEPGIGKSSLAFTSHLPICEDYDGGVQRAVGRKTTLLIEKWEDAIEFHKSKDFEEMSIKTLIIDTGGSMLDRFIAAYVIRQDAKNGRSGGELALSGYGAMKTVFQAFVNDMKAKGINIIFVCHAETQKEGDNIKYIPKMTGGSYDIMMSCADLVGYMESQNNKRTIDFNSTDRHIGKNTAEFKLMEIPHYTDPNYATFMADIIDRTIAKMMESSEAQKEAIQIIEKYKASIAAGGIEELEVLLGETESLKPMFKVQVIKMIDEKYVPLCNDMIVKLSNAEEFDGALTNIGEFPPRYQEVIKKLLWKQAKTVGLDFDMSTSKFVKAAPNANVAQPSVIPPKPKTGGLKSKGETAVQQQMM